MNQYCELDTKYCNNKNITLIKGKIHNETEYKMTTTMDIGYGKIYS